MTHHHGNIARFISRTLGVFVTEFECCIILLSALSLGWFLYVYTLRPFWFLNKYLNSSHGSLLIFSSLRVSFTPSVFFVSCCQLLASVVGAFLSCYFLLYFVICLLVSCFNFTCYSDLVQLCVPGSSSLHQSPLCVFIITIFLCPLPGRLCSQPVQSDLFVMVPWFQWLIFCFLFLLTYTPLEEKSLLFSKIGL